jgi:hypothetical protein
VNIPNTLAQHLRTRNIIPFAGAGVSMAVIDSHTHTPLFPSWRKLLETAAIRLDEENKAPYAYLVRGFLGINPPNYLEAAKQAKEGLGPLWFKFLKEQFDFLRVRVVDESLDLAKSIWQLGSQLVITTNYDRVLTWACPNPDNLRRWSIEAVAEMADAFGHEITRPTIWHLHGHIDNTEGLILTPDGYNKLYPEQNKTQENYKATLEFLRSKLVSQSLLFVGFSLDDEYFDNQMRLVYETFRGASGPHYALIRSADEARVRELKVPNIELITFSDFGEPLLTLLRSFIDLVNTPPQSISINTSNFNSEPLVNLSLYNTNNYVFFVPYRAKGNQVIGRENTMQAIRNQLIEGNPTNIGQAAAFQGLGGLGKTQLAVEYAYQFKDTYSKGVIWLNADQDIEAQLIKVADEGKWIAPDSEPKDKLAIAINRLKTFSDCLLIFDNVEKFEAIENYLPEPEATPHIIITSRVDQPNFSPVFIETLDKSDSLKLLVQEAGRSPNGESDTKAAQEIVKALDGLPLALELAGAYLKHRPAVTWNEYYDLLNQSLRKALPGKIGSFTKHEADLYSTLRISEELFAEEPMLRQILHLLSWSGSAPMGEELMCALLDMSNPTELMNPLGLGTSLRLLHRSPDNNSYSIHRLVSQVHQEEIPLSGRVDWVIHTCQRIYDWFVKLKDTLHDSPKFDSEINHLKAWQNHAIKYAPEQASALTWLLAYPAYHHGFHKEAKALMDLAQEQYVTFNNKDKNLEANLLVNAASLNSMFGDLPLANGQAQKALAISLEVFGEDSNETSLVYATLSSLSRLSEQYRQALAYRQKSFEIYSKLHGKDSYEAASSLVNMAVLTSYLNNKSRALAIMDEALEIILRIKGNKHPLVGVVMNDMGVILSNHNDYKGAKEKYEEAIKFSIEVFGENHPNVAAALNNAASCYMHIQKHDLALEYAERALAIRLELLGENNRQTDYSYYTIGDIYLKTRQYNLALASFEKSLNICLKLYGDKDSSTIRTLMAMANTLWAMGRKDKAYNLIDQSLRILPSDHSDYSALKHLKRSLLSSPLRPGFKQPGGKNSAKKRKKKKR